MATQEKPFRECTLHYMQGDEPPDDAWVMDWNM